MTLSEIDHEFDILYNNIDSGAAPALNDYEKSVLLTKAQEEIIINYYNGANARMSSFESSEEIRRYLDSLIRTESLNQLSASTENGFNKYTYSKPEKLLFILREEAIGSGEGCDNGRNLMIVPVSHETFNRVIRNPFKGPSDMKAVRLDNTESSSVVFEVYSKKAIGEYRVVYLKKPEPIVLYQLPSGYSVDGVSQPSNSDAPEAVMRKIINRAVELAKVAYIGDLGATLSINGRSQ